MKNHFSAAAIGAASLLGFGLLEPSSALAAIVSFSHYTPETAVPFSDVFQLQLFDTNLGVLDGVTVTLSSTVTGQVNVFNSTGSPQSFSNAYSSVPVTVTGPAGTTTSVSADASVAAGTVAAGMNGFAGVPGTDTNSVSVLASDFGSFEGAGVTYGSFTTASSRGIYGGTAIPGVFFSGSAAADGTVTITYDYTPGGAAVVPAPDTIALFASGMAMVGVIARRNSKKKAGTPD